jgi:5,5'-dehydrodivanillate O-demethylase
MGELMRRYWHPVVFPQILFVGSIVTGSLQYRVPVDDTHTMHYTWFFYRPGPGADKSLLPQQDSTPYWYVPLYDESGVLIPDLVNHQGFVAWITQGAVADRSHEILGESDRGVIMYRKMLDQQMAIVEDGGDPLGTVRDAKVNQCIDLPLERWQALSHPARLASYARTQAAEPLENISNIEKILKTWANETPWVAV